MSPNIKDESKIEIFVNDIQIVADGISTPYNHQSVVIAMNQPIIRLKVNLNIGSAIYTVYTCDFTHDYIDINADYRN